MRQIYNEDLRPVELTTQPMIDVFGETLPAVWRPAAGETPYKTRSGIRVLLCFNTRTGEKAFLNCDSDIFLSADDAILAHQLG